MLSHINFLTYNQDFGETLAYKIQENSTFFPPVILNLLSQVYRLKEIQI